MALSKIKFCLSCGTPFTPTGRNSKYCSDTCRRFPMQDNMYHVYAWYDADRLLYIGHGRKARAECYHEDNEQLMLARVAAEERGTFRMVYLVHNIEDKELACQVERAFTRLVNPPYNRN